MTENLTFTNIILNNAHCNAKALENFILLTAKFHIYRAKNQEVLPNIIKMQQEIQNYEIMEQKIAMKNKKMRIHDEKWNQLKKPEK